ncbi:penicillin-binding protein 1C [bacterium]|nr:penicillin-binding protein 1C [bacterium]MBU1958870.1 penicillin-binding protein 1C [bacterium]
MKTIKYTIMMLFGMIILFSLLNYLYPLNTARLNKPQSTLIYDRDEHLITVKLSPDGFLRMPIKTQMLTDDIKKIVLGYEDQYFEKHFGVNPLAIVRALWFNVTNQRTIGASTITMQVARMMHHEPRTLKQKLIEIFQAFQLEWNYSKEEILTFYLNNAPYGGNVEGFASASFRYFNLSVSSLSLSQIAYLTSIPKNPNANRPNANHPKKGRKINPIKNRLLTRLYELDVITQKDYQRAMQERIAVKIKNLPHRVPHLSTQIKEQGEIHTTMDMHLQSRVEKLLFKQVNKLKKFAIYNGAALVIDNKSMEILVYVGSHNFDDKKHGGQNDGVKALVSPGSTLKPFVYARALEEGIISPLKKLYDVPLFIEGYKPTNYAKEYLGEVTATEALQFSLNIPAVELDRLLGEKSLYSLLQESNLSSLSKPKAYYGSALSLGGFGISLKDNAERFSMLANGGRFEKATFLKENRTREVTQLLTAQSTYLVSNMLADAPRLNFSSSWEYMEGMPKVAFKTGTSARAKDMLTIGYTPEYTVAVWYGNFSGKASNPYNHTHATGLKVASPTLFKIFKLLEEKKRQTWFKKPQGISTQTICQDAIQINACKAPIKDQLIKEVKLKTPCSAMRAEVLSYLLKNQKIEHFKSLKSHRCYEEWKSYKPLITSPVHNKSYAHNRLLPNELKKTMLECYSFEENSTIYWLIDNEEPIVGESSVPLYRYLTPEKHSISCLDEGAKMQSISIISEEL